jgi:D-glycerate 3-kinase
MTEAWIPAFLAEHGLPERFHETLDRVCRPLADWAAGLRPEGGRTVVAGLCGAQGSGKSTIAGASARLLRDRGLAALCISIDDFYLRKAERERLAQQVHPLLATRGPPGTHDVGLADAVLDLLHRPGPVLVPVFDKAADDRRPVDAWRAVQAPLDVILLEGWCVGARPQDRRALARPVNAFEAEEDAGGVWRRYVNRQLGGPYRELFSRLDGLALLAAPGFEAVPAWRAEQERKLIERAGAGMSEAALARFLAHYERLTRWILAEMPARADLVFRLDADRRPLARG